MALAQVWARFLHCGSQLKSVDKSLLSKLRKKTGFPFNNCKKALEIQNNDFALAESWLREQARKEGWDKATKLASRSMSQGLVGIHVADHCASMIEVNCETDFVARNANFQNLVSRIALACLEAGKKTCENKISWNHDSLSQLPAEGGNTLADLVALSIGLIGENMAVRRGVFVRATGTHSYIGSYAHGSDSSAKTIAGKYGALVTFTVSGQQKTGDLSVTALGRQLAQHVVGMNPSRVGEDNEREEVTVTKAVAGQAGGINAAESVMVDEVKHLENSRPKLEARMIFQEFLLDPEICVREFLARHSGQVSDFVRYECGEDLNDGGHS